MNSGFTLPANTRSLTKMIAAVGRYTQKTHPCHTTSLSLTPCLQKTTLIQLIF